MSALVGRPVVRLVVWVVLLVLVALACALAHFGPWVILGVMAATWLVVAAIELSVSRRTGAPALQRPPERQVAQPAPEVEHVRVLRSARPEPPAAGPPPPPAPEPEPEPEPEPQLEPEPEPELEPEPVATAPPPPVERGPGGWNVWSLEELVRAGSGDAARDEERAYVLMYLRDFADAAGVLPTQFDDLVHETFGDLIGAVDVR